MSAAMDRHLARFSRAWTRAIYVGTSNELVRPLVEQGLLEKRQAPPPFDGHKGNTATEYRLTDAGAARLEATVLAEA